MLAPAYVVVAGLSMEVIAQQMTYVTCTNVE
jgi:hypothetical protein